MRIRSIKPEFWQSETIAKVSHFARLLAIAILNYSDDDGHFWFSIPVIRGALFPFDEPSPNIRGGFAELSHIGFLEIGDLEGKHVCRIPHFLRHQKIDKPQKPRLSVKNPVFPSESWKFDEPSPNIREFPSTGTEEQGNRGTGEQGKGEGLFCPPAAPKPAKVADPIIETIYQAYPLKSARIEAIKSIEKAIKIVEPTLLLEKVQAYAQAIAIWPKEERDQFVPLCATWMNKGRWTDDPATWASRHRAPSSSSSKSDQRFLFKPEDYTNSQPLSSDRNR